MTHACCALLHWLAAQQGSGYHRVESLTLMGAIPEARRLQVVECPETGDILDQYFLRLTERGREAANEGKCAMEVTT